MAEFKRGLGTLAEKLENEPLFNSRLKKDIEKENNDLFFAVRGGYASFYFKGCSLFKYDNNGFSTHYKYAFVPDEVPQSNYITEKDLEKMTVEKNFQKGYNKIKDNIGLYKSDEAEGVSALYKFAPKKNNRNNRYFLVDIEISFESKQNEDDEVETERKSTDRIDILLYDNVKKQLLFCEAKHFSNKEIWAKTGNVPAVIKQLNKYNVQISKNKDLIINEYKKTFEIYNKLFGSVLNPPENIYEKCGLLIFGYDSMQKEKIDKLIKDDGSLTGHKWYSIGGMNNIKIENFYNQIKD